eukprot:365221-Chlamydomonas_euryale.AAC.2
MGGGLCVPQCAMQAACHGSTLPWFMYVCMREPAARRGSKLLRSMYIHMRESAARYGLKMPQVMNMADADKKVEFVERWQRQPLVSTTVVTCLEVMKQVWMSGMVRGGRDAGRGARRGGVRSGTGRCAKTMRHACMHGMVHTSGASDFPYFPSSLWVSQTQ